MGKSLVINSLENQLPEFANPVVHVVYPLMDAAGLVRYIGGSIAGRDRITADSTIEAVIVQIESALKEATEADRQTVVVIDEAHLLEECGLLEPVRLLLNLAAGKGTGESAITLILCGQPTLMAQVNRNVSLDERIAVRCILNRFSIDETNAYISHRLRVAGGQTDDLFASSAIEQIYSYSDGVPRRINRLCDLALMVGYAQECKLIDGDLIQDVQQELSTPAVVQ
jgi:general secretion pathway protein A